jgi:flagellar protein FliO/FliZ
VGLAETAQEAVMDAATYARFALALLFVLGLILVISWAIRRFGLAGRFAPNPGKKRRLEVVEVAPLDARHKLVMVKRDAVEHLLLIGGGDPIVVERNIDSTAAARPAAPDFAQELKAETPE